ncbi:hypothetical protein K1719_015443 [Acacia pycnantha]|nr:hypothetical protein K1719_015443 [Acacia pycnantha]
MRTGADGGVLTVVSSEGRQSSSSVSTSASCASLSLDQSFNGLLGSSLCLQGTGKMSANHHLPPLPNPKLPPMVSKS